MGRLRRIFFAARASAVSGRVVFLRIYMAAN
jgi:hypothetical protein